MGKGTRVWPLPSILSLPGLYEQDGSKNCKALEYFKGLADNIH